MKKLLTSITGMILIYITVLAVLICLIVYKHNNHSKKNLEYAPTGTYSFVILDNKNPLTYNVEKALEQYEKNYSPTEM